MPTIPSMRPCPSSTKSFTGWLSFPSLDLSLLSNIFRMTEVGVNDGESFMCGKRKNMENYYLEIFGCRKSPGQATSVDREHFEFVLFQS